MQRSLEPDPYTQPSELISVIQQDGWAIIQGYKFVTGTSSVTGFGWDCTGTDPATHWTTKSELYCYNDWLSVVDSIPATAAVVGTAAIAQAQGRVMRGGSVSSIRLTPASPVVRPGAMQSFTVTGYDAAGRAYGDVTLDTSFTIDGAGTCTANACGASDPGTYTVTAVHRPTGATATQALTVADGPAITQLAPSSGRTGTAVTISGASLGGASAVAFNGVPASFSVVSSTQIAATVPALASTGRVTVTTPAGTATSPASFTVLPAIASFSPAAGFVGSIVTVRGSGFTGASGAWIGGVAVPFTVVLATEIRATVSVAALTGKVGVRTPSGTVTSTANFAVRPRINGFNPASGPPGTSVTITGSGLRGPMLVTFNGVAASFTLTSTSSIVAKVPASATTGRIRVRTAGGTATSATDFTVVASLAAAHAPPA